MNGTATLVELKSLINLLANLDRSIQFIIKINSKISLHKIQTGKRMAVELVRLSG